MQQSGSVKVDFDVDARWQPPYSLKCCPGLESSNLIRGDGDLAFRHINAFDNGLSIVVVHLDASFLFQSSTAPMTDHDR